MTALGLYAVFSKFVDLIFETYHRPIQICLWNLISSCTPPVSDQHCDQAYFPCKRLFHFAYPNPIRLFHEGFPVCRLHTITILKSLRIALLDKHSVLYSGWRGADISVWKAVLSAHGWFSVYVCLLSLLSFSDEGHAFWSQTPWFFNLISTIPNCDNWVKSLNFTL